MIPKKENFENIFVNIYDIGSFTKLMKRTQTQTFLNWNFETSYFKSNKIKPYFRKN